jgi:YHS domain-containing protein
MRPDHDAGGGSMADVVCAVCGGKIGDDDDAYTHIEHAGEAYPICGKACAEGFKTEPDKYAK